MSEQKPVPRFEKDDKSDKIWLHTMVIDEVGLIHKFSHLLDRAAAERLFEELREVLGR